MPKLGNNWDFVKNQALNMKLQNILGDPSSLVAADLGLVWIDTTGANGVVKVYDGVAVDTVTNIIEGVGVTAPLVLGSLTNKIQALSVSPATTTLPGTMSGADKLKLDGIANGATAGTGDAHLAGIETFTGAKTFSAATTFSGTVSGLVKADVGLGSVDNTTDVAKPVSTATTTALNLKANLASPAFTGTPTGLTKAHVGLTNVDNTTDLAKPLSTAATTALGLKADLANPAFTGTPTGITKTHVGLGSVDNTTDLAKPVSTATTTALGLKANAASPAFTGTPTGLTKTHVGLANVDNTTDLAKPLSTAATTALGLKADLVGGLVPTSQLPSISLGTSIVVASQVAMLALTSIQVQPGDLAIRSDGAGTFMLMTADPSVLANWNLLESPTDVVTSVNGDTGIVVLSKTDLGLGNADNTSDAAKPVSTLTQTALNLKANAANPVFTGTITGIDKTDVGLANVDNTTDLGKPVSTATTTALNLKANLASPAFTGTPTGLTKAHVGLTNVDNTADSAKPVSTAQATALGLKADAASPAFTGTPTGLTKAHVGLTNVDNTADSAKPVSTAQATADGLRLLATNNLSDVPNDVTARINIGAVGKYAVDIGGTTTIVVTHGLNTKDVVVSLFEIATGTEIYADLEHTNTTTSTLRFSVAPSAASLRCVVVG